MTKAQQQITHNRAKRVAEYAQAHALRQQGWTMKAISTHMGRHHRTIRKYLTYSPRLKPGDSGIKRWQPPRWSYIPALHTGRCPFLIARTLTWQPQTRCYDTSVA
jgi:hypothetical protein